jgi:hypothetical protein
MMLTYSWLKFIDKLVFKMCIVTYIQTSNIKLFTFFWVNPRRLCVTGRRFGTHYQFHLHRQVDEEWLGMG